MKKTIKSISRTADAYHPAIGYQYLIVFEDNSMAITSDDDLIHQFGDSIPRRYPLRDRDHQELVGKEFEVQE